MNPDEKRADLMDESDRGCVIVAAAILDDRLTELFEDAFSRNDVSKTLRDSLFDLNGPLSSFSAKIKLAYALGFIAKPTYLDLEAIRQLRNDFAHSRAHADFLDASVVKRVEALNCTQPYKTRFTRYSPSGDVPEPRDAHLRVNGFVKYHKSLFCLGVADLECAILDAAIYLKTGLTVQELRKQKGIMEQLTSKPE